MAVVVFDTKLGAAGRLLGDASGVGLLLMLSLERNGCWFCCCSNNVGAEVEAILLPL